MNKQTRLPLPILGAVFGCLTGIVWQEYSIIKNPWILLAIFMLSLPLALYAYKMKNQKQLRSITFFLCMIGSACTYELPQHALRTIAEKYHNIPTTIHGIIQDVREERGNKIITLGEITIETQNVTRAPFWFTRAIVTTSAFAQTPIGGIMHLSNMYIKPPAETLRPYHLKEHLLGFFFPKKESLLVSDAGENSQSWIEKQKARLNRSIIDVFSLATRNMVKSIFIGQSQALTSETRSLFEQWGISHYLARSGLHLVLLATLIIFLLQACHLPIFITRGVALVLSVLYHLVTTPSTSFLRAFMMNMSIGAALFLGTTPTVLHLFSVVTLATILTNPFTIFNLDFQLSFGISGALIFMFNVIRKIEDIQR